MDKRTFEHEIMKAAIFNKLGERVDYWMGYQRGLRRRYHGENFGTLEEHIKWMSLSGDSDPSRAERGRGYRDGYGLNNALQDA